MKKNHWILLSIGIALAFGIYAIPAITQQPGQPPATQRPFQVAVIDLAQVIRAHPDFSRRQNELQEQVRTAEAEFQRRQEGIEQSRRALEQSGLRAGSPEHQRAFDQLASQVAQFEADVRAQHRRFALMDSQIMYDIHTDIKKTIERVATAGNIAQVTDFRDFEVDPANPQSVAENMDQRLVWFSPGLNITNTIVMQVYADRRMEVPAEMMAKMQAGQPIR
jgi:Skp family chaperone for outer membrane proteins